jgi:hypothetical protein
MNKFLSIKDNFEAEFTHDSTKKKLKPLVESLFKIFKYSLKRGKIVLSTFLKVIEAIGEDYEIQLDDEIEELLAPHCSSDEVL